jgi:hypothetical protein
MGIRLDVAPDRLLRTTDLLDYQAAYTIAGWARIVTDTNAYACICSLNAAANRFDYLGLLGDGTTLAAIMESGAGYSENTGGTSLTVGSWYFLAMVRASLTDLRVFLGAPGTAVAQNGTTVTTSAAGRAAVARNEIGGFTSGNLDPFNGRVGPWKAWSAALTAAELQAEMTQTIPLRAANLYGAWPLRDAADLTDISGNGRAWTAGGTLTTEDGPPVAWGPPLDLGYRPRGFAVYP